MFNNNDQILLGNTADGGSLSSLEKDELINNNTLINIYNLIFTEYQLKENDESLLENNNNKINKTVIGKNKSKKQYQKLSQNFGLLFKTDDYNEYSFNTEKESEENILLNNKQKIKIDEHLNLKEFLIIQVLNNCNENFVKLNELIPEFTFLQKVDHLVTCKINFIKNLNINNNELNILQKVNEYIQNNIIGNKELINKDLLLIPNIENNTDFTLPFDLLSKYFTKNNSFVNNNSILDELNELFLEFKNNKNNEIIKEKIVNISQKYNTKIIRANHNNILYILKHVDFTKCPNFQMDSHQTFIEYYENKYNYKIKEELNQPLIKCEYFNLQNFIKYRKFKIFNEKHNIQQQSKKVINNSDENSLQNNTLQKKHYNKYNFIYLIPELCSILEYDIDFILQLKYQNECFKQIEEQLNFYKNKINLFKNNTLQNFNNINPFLLRIAFTLTSYSIKNLKKYSNERFEFFGDSIVNFTIVNFIIKNFRKDISKKGDWMEVISHFIKNDYITNCVKDLNLENYLLSNQANFCKKLISNVFEAIIGGLFLEFSYNDIYLFIVKYIIPNNIYNYKYLNIPILELFNTDNLEDINSTVDTSNDITIMELNTLQNNIEELNLTNLERNVDNYFTNTENEINDLNTLQNLIKYKFKNINLLKEALIHHSYNNTNTDILPILKQIENINDKKRYAYYKKSLDKKLLLRNNLKSNNLQNNVDNFKIGNFHEINNEQFKTLGNAILKFLISEYLFKTFPNTEPKELTLMVHLIMNKNDVIFRNIQNELHLERFIKFNSSNVNCHNENESNNNNGLIYFKNYECFCSLIGAIYVDNNFEFYTYYEDCSNIFGDKDELLNNYYLKRHDICKEKFIYEFIIKNIIKENINPFTITSPIKIELQHLVQNKYKCVPQYKTIANNVENDNNNDKFKTQIFIENKENKEIIIISEATSNTVEEAEKLAIEKGIALLSTIQ
ncbi:hypothetical protein ABK040_004869 [Willaertia magna]